MDKKQLLTVHDVAFLLRLNPKTVYKMVLENRIPFHRLTGMKAIRFDWSEIERWWRGAKRANG